MPNNPLSEPVHEDFRGQIRRYDINGVKFNILFTKAGMYRSGDYHSARQFDVVLHGELEITIREGDKDIVFIKKANEKIEIPPNVPHLYKSLTDTVILEWYDGILEPKYYPPYRKFVDSQSKETQH